MIKFILGFVFGVVVATIGFAGMAKVLDKGVVEIQKTAKEATK